MLPRWLYGIVALGIVGHANATVPRPTQREVRKVAFVWAKAPSSTSSSCRKLKRWVQFHPGATIPAILPLLAHKNPTVGSLLLGVCGFQATGKTDPKMNQQIVRFLFEPNADKARLYGNISNRFPTNAKTLRKLVAILSSKASKPNKDEMIRISHLLPNVLAMWAIIQAENKTKKWGEKLDYREELDRLVQLSPLNHQTMLLRLIRDLPPKQQWVWIRKHMVLNWCSISKRECDGLSNAQRLLYQGRMFKLLRTLALSKQPLLGNLAADILREEKPTIDWSKEVSLLSVLYKRNDNLSAKILCRILTQASEQGFTKVDWTLKLSAHSHREVRACAVLLLGMTLSKRNQAKVWGWASRLWKTGKLYHRRRVQTFLWSIPSDSKEFENKKLVSFLIRGLKDKRWGVYKNAILLMMFHAHRFRRVPRVIRRALKYGPVSVRCSAVRMIYRMKHPSKKAIQLLVKAIRDRSWSISMQATVSLWNKHPITIVQLLKKGYERKRIYRALRKVIVADSQNNYFPSPRRPMYRQTSHKMIHCSGSFYHLRAFIPLGRRKLFIKWYHKSTGLYLYTGVFRKRKASKLAFPWLLRALRANGSEAQCLGAAWVMGSYNFKRFFQHKSRHIRYLARCAQKAIKTSGAYVY